MTADAFDPRYELEARVVEVLRADAGLSALLFRDRPSVTDDDKRVYREASDLPEAVREVLPRVLVGAREDDGLGLEQDDSAAPLARATVFIHSLVDAGQQQLGEQIASRVRVILGSTPLSASHIIASALVQVGVAPPVRESEFKDAWRFTREYRAGLVGVPNA